MPPSAKVPTDKLVESYYRHDGVIAEVAREFGLARSTVSERLRAAKIQDKPALDGRVGEMRQDSRSLPSEGAVKRYILTSAQNNTAVHPEVWRNLKALAEHYDAEIMVSRFTYNKRAYAANEVKPGTTDDDVDTLWYDEAVGPYVCDWRVKLAPGLVWCGEMNILPTAVDPLSGFETYTGRKSGVFPHVKVAMRSVASAKYEPTKFNYTTGTVTQRNYIQKKAGLKAEWEHVYGAVLVEVDHEGDWFVRQLIADDDGAICDLDARAVKGKVTTGHRVEAINWGDIHVAYLSQEIFDTCWGARGIMDTLRPRYQFMHDLCDVRAFNPHTRRNHHARFKNYVEGVSDALVDINQVGFFLKEAARPWCETVVVASNHDNWFQRWLVDTDFRDDPTNAVLYLEAQLRTYRAIADGVDERSVAADVLAWVLREYGECPEDTRFLKLDESFVICKDQNNGIECGHHGHYGVNGARGSARSFARSGRRTNTGHTHSAGIWGGSWVAGVIGALDMVYNAGLSSWSYSLIVTHQNGKRQIVTIWRNKWRANQPPTAGTTSKPSRDGASSRSRRARKTSRSKT